MSFRRASITVGIYSPGPRPSKPNSRLIRRAWTEIVRRRRWRNSSARLHRMSLGASVQSRPMSALLAYGGFSRQPVQCTTGSVYHEIGTKAECALEGKGLRRQAGGRRHHLTRDDRGRSRACDYIIAPSIRSLPLLRRFRGISAEAGRNRCLHVVSGVLNHTQGVTDAQIRTKPPTQFAEAGCIRFATALRPACGTPLLLLGYFTANLDKWDPR